ncbi:hypothetical protein [Archangium primigenium]|uniref:hypothetical protein n=1 Tax=[Archangium] primigenium TaxID=2792470 RepID=UPI00195DF822|nr:hypothetical protein [Archangium primigenium]MBM7116226.1 hypothetical protein [Archangium primigenium]
MATPPSWVLEFPALFHDHKGAVLRKIKAQGQAWAREYLKTGAFTPPRQTLQVVPGDVLVMHSGADFDVSSQPRWRLHAFVGVFSCLNEGIPKESRQRAREAFESFCLSTPWGALYHAVSPPPLRSAERMAKRLASVLHFWDVLEGPRYAFWSAEQRSTLDELVENIHGKTLRAWCPGYPSSLRGLLELTVGRMSRATREECMEAVLRLMPVLVAEDPEFKHREKLCDPHFLRERLAALASDDFEEVSGGYTYAVTARLAAWDRELGP